MTWATDRRLDYIDWRLATHGSIVRADLARTFSIATVQASYDLAAYQRDYPHAITYDKSRKCYVAAPRFRRQRKGPWTSAIDWATADGR